MDSPLLGIVCCVATYL